MAKRLTIRKDHIQVKSKFKLDDAYLLEYASGLAGASIEELVRQSAIAAARMIVFESEQKRKQQQAENIKALEGLHEEAK
jgi:hypothetical protein